VGSGIPDEVTAIVPVKALELAKSRLDLPDRSRRSLAVAFAQDTVSTLAAAPLVTAVVVVTSDPVVAQAVAPSGAQVVPDGGLGLDAAVGLGSAVATVARPGTAVLVVPADLPCLRAVDVARVLATALGTDGAFVPDRSGHGTTMVVVPAGRPVLTSYGDGSAVRHAALGLAVLRGAPVRARHDVDTLTDLDRAAALGLGAATTAVLAGADRPVADRSGRGRVLTRRRWRPTP
jgi:2-phospho-L-lactate guanylyltransferase